MEPYTDPKNFSNCGGRIFLVYLCTMQEAFTLQFDYKNKLQEIDCVLRVSSYTYQFLCRIEDVDMILEKDDEGNFRALEANPAASRHGKPDPGLIRELIKEMERILQ
jgi:hypothetical protein